MSQNASMAEGYSSFLCLDVVTAPLSAAKRLGVNGKCSGCEGRVVFFNMFVESRVFVVLDCVPKF